MPASGTTSLSFPTATGALARLAAEQALAAGADLDRPLRMAGLTRGQIDDENARIGATQQIAFVQTVADMLHRPCLGFELAQGFELRRIGLLYYVAASSETLVEALRRIERFSGVGNEAVQFSCVSGRALEIGFRYRGVARHSDRHQGEFFLAALLRVCRQLTGRNLTPVRALLSHVRSDDRKQYAAFFGCEIAFEAEADGIVLAKEHEKLPLVGADTYLNQMLVRISEGTLANRSAESRSRRTSIENITAPILPHGKARLSEVAQQLHSSQRTLARRLADEGLSFAGILDEMRRDLALRYLQDRRLSVSRIAWLLGYQEVSAFTHAFRRWRGE